MRTLVLILSLRVASAIHDVPLGECHQCEVTCFEDCSAKYQKEILDDDLGMFLQQPKENKTVQMVSKYTKCLEEDQCPCKETQDKEAALVKGTKQVALMAGEKKKKGQCAAMVPCSAQCAAKVADADIASMVNQTNNTVNASKRSLLQKRSFPLHSVKIGAFSKGKMTLDHCFKYCLAATCGCADAPGLGDKNAAIKANAVAKGVTDTKPSAHFRPAKVDECAKGMPGKKVAKGLYIKLGGGAGGMVEVCTKDFISKVLGPDGDPAAVAKKCKSSASDDAKYGCVWDKQKSVCHVGFSPILRCQTKYFNDK